MCLEFNTTHMTQPGPSSPIKRDVLVWICSRSDLDHKVLSLFLDSYCNRITSFLYSDECLHALTITLPDLIILDMHTCTEPSGYEFVQNVRKHHSSVDLPILLLSTSKYETSTFEVIDCGANDFVYKPLRHSEVIFRVRALLEARKQYLQQELLYDIIPKQFLNHIIKGNTGCAQKHECVTILFSDIVGFTELSTIWNPQQVIRMLHRMFSQFDEFSLETGVYKVETIGDAYMAVCGQSNTDKKHASKISDMAIMMCDYVKKYMQSFESPLQIRIGIHTGPALSGVIGKIRPRYCLFGDTVNTASRMESHGIPGQIQLSRNAYERLKEEEWIGLEMYELTKRTVDVKGKGVKNTYMIKVDLPNSTQSP